MPILTMFSKMALRFVSSVIEEAHERYAANINAGINGYGERPAVGEPGTGESSAGKEGFLSNAKATLDYTPRVNGKPASDPQTSEFPHPVTHGPQRTA